jgi:hypothetical protein
MRVWVAFLGVGFAGCFGGGGSADIRGAEVALGAAASLGHASSLAMDAMAGSTVCTQVTAPCTTYPCTGGVNVSLGAPCPLPLGSGDAAGSVTVTGSWQSADSATLATMFVNEMVGAKSVVVVNATDLTVQHSTNGDVTVSYVGQNVNVMGVAALAAQSSWTVNVSAAGTPADPADDKYTITGVNQGAGGASNGQLSLDSVVIDPTMCRLNPISGSGVIQNVSATSIQQTTLKFHSACDGKVDVTGTLGGNNAVPLDFFR